MTIFNSRDAGLFLLWAAGCLGDLQTGLFLQRSASLPQLGLTALAWGYLGQLQAFLNLLVLTDFLLLGCTILNRNGMAILDWNLLTLIFIVTLLLINCLAFILVHFVADLFLLSVALFVQIFEAVSDGSDLNGCLTNLLLYVLTADLLCWSTQSLRLADTVLRGAGDTNLFLLGGAVGGLVVHTDLGVTFLTDLGGLTLALLLEGRGADGVGHLVLQYRWREARMDNKLVVEGGQEGGGGGDPAFLLTFSGGGSLARWWSEH